MAAPDLILHHYPRSPFAEKIRVTFGLKRLRWRSVEQPRIAPKPQLVPLTGGYRRIPVLQIGADIYCDTRRIVAELEKRFPEASLYPPGTRGHADIIADWADQTLFATSLGLVFGLNGDRFPPELHADRARFTAGKFDGWNSEKMRPLVPSLRVQFRHQLSWVNDCLAKGGPFMLGVVPSLADIAVYHPLWYARGNLGEGEGLANCPRVLAWMDRMVAIGHGVADDMTAAQAVSIAREAQPDAVAAVGGGECGVGGTVSVTPTDWGFDTVQGSLVFADDDSIAVRRDDPDAGTLIVHFPRTGFAVATA